MQSSKRRLLHETLRRYIRRQAWEHLKKVINKTRVEDLAAVTEAMSESDQLTVFRHLPDNVSRAEFICQMLPPFGQHALEPMAPDEAAAVLKEMATDDMADILQDLPEDKAAAILEVLEASDEVAELMAYGDETAGGIMVPEFVALEADDTVDEAIAKLRESLDVEMVYYVYVVNQHDHLVGVLSLRRLVSAPPKSHVRDIMETDVISVTTDTDQERVANMVARYGFVAVPVVDESNKLVGIVTVDDVIDVLREEATEDMLKMAGAGTDLSETKGVLGNVMVRFPWLLASCMGGLIAAAVMDVFEETLTSHYFLALFLPIILGMSGNVGTQAATVTVRAIAVGQITHRDSSWAAVRKEVLIGIVLGVSYGCGIGIIAAILAGQAAYGLVIGLSIIGGMTVASTVGTALPVVFSRLNIDPAVATGPVVTTTVDILGVLTYFAIAAFLTASMMSTVS